MKEALPITEHFPRIGCGLLRVEIDFERHTVTLHLPEGDCTDWSGAVGYAEELDPDVRRVHTTGGGGYRREPDGEWVDARIAQPMEGTA